MKTFTDYFHDSERVYSYTLKLACDSVNEDCINAIETKLQRLDLVKLGEFKGSPLQENPLDFPNIHNTSVQTCEFEVKYPSSTDMLERMVSEALGMPRGSVIVYTENDPRKTYTQQHLERNSPEFKENYKARMGTKYQQEEEPDKITYGDYAEEMLSVLDDKRKKRTSPKYTTNKLIPDQKVEEPANSKMDMGPIGTKSPFSPETRD